MMRRKMDLVLEVDELVEVIYTMTNAKYRQQQENAANGKPKNDTRTERLTGIIRKAEKMLEGKKNENRDRDG